MIDNQIPHSGIFVCCLENDIYPKMFQTVVENNEFPIATYAYVVQIRHISQGTPDNDRNKENPYHWNASTCYPDSDAHSKIFPIMAKNNKVLYLGTQIYYPYNDIYFNILPIMVETTKIPMIKHEYIAQTMAYIPKMPSNDRKYLNHGVVAYTYTCSS